MKAKNTTRILLPKDYWQSKLSFNFKSEYIRYKKIFCKLTRKEKKMLCKNYDVTYRSWHSHIYNILCNLNTSELMEYRRFLNSRLKLNAVSDGLTKNYILPFSSAIAVSILFTPTFNYILQNDLIPNSLSESLIYLLSLVLFMTIMLIFFYFITIRLAKSVQDTELEKQFYIDMIEIVDQITVSVSTPLN